MLELSIVSKKAISMWYYRRRAKKHTNMKRNIVTIGNHTQFALPLGVEM